MSHYYFEKGSISLSEALVSDYFYSAFKLVLAPIHSFSVMLLEPMIRRRAALLTGLQMTSPALHNMVKPLYLVKP
jgi:hypothetical protein